MLKLISLTCPQCNRLFEGKYTSWLIKQSRENKVLCCSYKCGLDYFYRYKQGVKLCTKCHKTGEFCKDSRAKDGLQSQCKKCKVKSVIQYYTNNPLIRVQRNIGNRIRMSLKVKNVSKPRELHKLLGYTINELKQHLELRFQDGMSWDNYGQWHIDHIRPLISFKIKSTNSSAFTECWALTNLQPLWAEDNFKKRSRY